jgi:hypothetical protein
VLSRCFGNAHGELRDILDSWSNLTSRRLNCEGLGRHYFSYSAASNPLTLLTLSEVAKMASKGRLDRLLDSEKPAIGELKAKKVRTLKDLYGVESIDDIAYLTDRGHTAAKKFMEDVSDKLLEGTVTKLGCKTVLESIQEGCKRQEGVMTIAGEDGEQRAMPTGWPAFDAYCGGGVPRGGLMEVVGPSGVGKTQLAMSCVVECVGRSVARLAAGLVGYEEQVCGALFINTEGAGKFDLGRVVDMATARMPTLFGDTEPSVMDGAGAGAGAAAADRQPGSNSHGPQSFLPGGRERSPSPPGFMPSQVSSTASLLASGDLPQVSASASSIGVDKNGGESLTHIASAGTSRPLDPSYGDVGDRVGTARSLRPEAAQTHAQAQAPGRNLALLRRKVLVRSIESPECLLAFVDPGRAGAAPGSSGFQQSQQPPPQPQIPALPISDLNPGINTRSLETLLIEGRVALLVVDCVSNIAIHGEDYDKQEVPCVLIISILLCIVHHGHYCQQALPLL